MRIARFEKKTEKLYIIFLGYTSLDLVITGNNLVIIITGNKNGNKIALKCSLYTWYTNNTLNIPCQTN